MRQSPLQPQPFAGEVVAVGGPLGEGARGGDLGAANLVVEVARSTVD